MKGEGVVLVILVVITQVSAIHFNACTKCFGASPYRPSTTDRLVAPTRSARRHMAEFLSNLLDLKNEVSREQARFELIYHGGDASFLNLMTIEEQPSCLSRHDHITDPRMLLFEDLSTLALYLDFIQTNRHRDECNVHATRLCANDLLCKWRQVLSGLQLFHRYPRHCCRQNFPDNRITSCTHLRAIAYLMLRRSGEIITNLEHRVVEFIDDID